MKRINVATVIVSMSLLVPVVAASPANAAASVGASAHCELIGAHCVTGTGQAENAGTSTTGGYATAVCHGGSNGAILLEVTCSVGDGSSTTSLPGPTAAAAVITGTDTFLRQPVCWTVTGYFVQPLGGVNVVTTSGCSIISL
jgi:hypothetical protein